MKKINQKGITLVELIFSMGLVTLVAGLGVMSLNSLNKEIAAIDSKIQTKSDKITVSKSFLVLNKNISYSFNNINLQDDKNLNFFDLINDVSPMYFDNSKSRSLKFSYDSKIKEIYFISTEFEKGKFMYYDPTYAYDINDPDDIFQSPTFSYNSMNKMFKEGSSVGYVAANTQAWKKDQLFLLISPVMLRKKVVNSTVDFSKPPGFLSFIGYVNSDESDLVKLDKDPFKTIFFNINPVDGKSITSPDDFFRSIPSVGGSAGVVSLVPIKIVGFKAYAKESPDKSKKYIDLYRVEYNGAEKKIETLVLNSLSYIEFYRKSIFFPNIDLNYEVIK